MWITNRLTEYRGLIANRSLTRAVLAVSFAEGNVFRQTYCSANGIIFTFVLRRCDVMED
jgi:hypothetical protein